MLSETLENGLGIQFSNSIILLCLLPLYNCRNATPYCRCKRALRKINSLVAARVQKQETKDPYQRFSLFFLFLFLRGELR
jgi:hypothetical protein